MNVVETHTWLNVNFNITLEVLMFLSIKQPSSVSLFGKQYNRFCSRVFSSYHQPMSFQFANISESTRRRQAKMSTLDILGSSLLNVQASKSSLDSLS